MSNAMLHDQAQRFVRKVPDIQPGYTVRVHEKIQEGGKERVQIFEGLVLSVHNGHGPTDASFTVRKVVSGIGVEKVFPMHSPVLEKIDVKKVAKVRRAKLFFIRGRSGKSARMIERFTMEGEFQTPADELAVPETGTAEQGTEETMVTEAAPEAKASVESAAEEQRE